MILESLGLIFKVKGEITMSWKEEIKKYNYIERNLLKRKLESMIEILDSELHPDDKIAKVKGYLTGMLEYDF